MIVFTKEKDGFYGAFFPGTKFPNTVIIWAAGMGAGENAVISSSQFLRQAGFSVLCIGYAKWGALGAETSLIPLDYVSFGIERIYQYIKIRPLKIGMAGISLGALYALASACFIPDISALALASPFDYIMEGLDASLKPTGHGTFTWKGKELPYQPWHILEEQSKSQIFMHAVRDKNYGVQRIFRYIYDHNTWEERSALNIEKIKSDMLLLASKEDDCWPADVAVLRMVSRLKSSDSRCKVEYHLYEKGCHNLGGDMNMKGWTGIKIRLLMKAWRTHPKECQVCIEDSKKRILDFFYRTLL